MTYKVAINGFGRIGRNLFRISIDQTDFEIAAINDITTAETLAHLLKYDSIFGKSEKRVEVGENYIAVDGKEIRVFAERDPRNLPWSDLGIELVVGSTGLFRNRNDTMKHLNTGAKKVIISAPATEQNITLVLGINNRDYVHTNHYITSNASCTTNCVALATKVSHDHFAGLNGNMSMLDLIPITREFSTGGGTSLEFLSGKKLPGIESLSDT